jgi:HEAT repeat protein
MMSRALTRLPALCLVLLTAAAPAQDQPPAKGHLAGRSLEAWLEDLDHDDVLVREEAALVLHRAGPAGRAAVPRLRRLLGHANRSLRGRAALALWRLGGAASPAVTALAENLGEASPLTRREALVALAEMGEQAAPAAGAVLRLRDDPDAAVRAQAGTTLARMGGTALPAVLDALQGKEVGRRRAAIALLVGTMPHAPRKEHLVALADLLKDEDLRVRVDVARLLWARGQTGKAIVTALEEGARAAQWSVRDGVLTTLADSPSRPREIIPLLEAGLLDADEGQRLRAARLLFEVEKKHSRFLPVLIAVIG